MKTRNLLLAVVSTTLAGTAFGYVPTWSLEAAAGAGSMGAARTTILFEKAALTNGLGAATDVALSPAQTSTNGQGVIALQRDDRMVYVTDPYPRDAEEWQGMLVNRAASASCAGEGFCQSALACVNKRCGACADDSQCQPGEVCAVDHCLRAELSTCSSRLDCPAEDVCVLSGYSEDARGNGDMQSWCSGSVPNRDTPRHEYPPEAYVEVNPSPESRLMRALQAGGGNAR